MSLEQLARRVKRCKKCSQKNRFWYFPSCNGVSGFFGEKNYIFVCSQPHEGEFDPLTLRFDRRLYDNMKKYGFGKAHLTDMVKCRGEKYKELSYSEVSNCLKWLYEEVDIVKPKAFIAMGSKSYAELTKNGFKPVLMLNHYSNHYISDSDYEEQFRALRDYLKSNEPKHMTKIADLIPSGQSTITPSVQEFGNVVVLLNKLRHEQKIDSSQYIEFRDRWYNFPTEREVILGRLKALE
jgi:hypothetical protein